MHGHGHRFDPKKADKLLSEERQESLNLKRVMELMDLHSEDVVADFGAGNGFFTVPFSEQVNQVLAVDIEPKMLDLLKEHAESKNQTNIEYVESDLQDINLSDDVADKGIIAFVMHEIPKMEVALNEFKRIIKSGGSLLIIDWEAVESESGPPLHERIASDDMKRFLEEQGYTPTLEHLNESVYLIKVHF
ncbi:class I SAM-dependent methyltransferase [Aquisalibacillus elongatus]|uniref:Methyltransferase family protein n=1 Tax=Aquisalibacillus elongatus TaxID=485577 RepID=A0A3N5C9T8_9BACI|nr:methyltransferase domain-containing protein [Aquisalibacillus elongatus]RPF53451.1 methyltransferase family protein [Aquisalibacillus elongatus]